MARITKQPRLIGTAEELATLQRIRQQVLAHIESLGPEDSSKASAWANVFYTLTTSAAIACTSCR